MECMAQKKAPSRLISTLLAFTKNLVVTEVNPKSIGTPVPVATPPLKIISLTKSPQSHLNYG